MEEEKRHVAFRETINEDLRRPSDEESDGENGGIANPSWSPSRGGMGPAVTSDEDEEPQGPPTADRDRKRRARLASRYDGPDLNVKFTRWREVRDSNNFGQCIYVNSLQK